MVLACEVLVYFVIYLVAHNAQAGGIVGLGVHELGPTELGVLTYLDDVLERGLDEGIEEVIEALDKAKRRLDANVNFELTMELLMLEIKENG